MPADLADSLKAVEEDRMTDLAPLVATTEIEVANVTATMETNLRQGDLETGLGSLSGDQASSEWEERQKSRADELRSRSLLRRSSPQSMRRGFVAVRHRERMCTEKELWLASESAGNSTGGRAHSSTAMLWFLLWTV